MVSKLLSITPVGFISLRHINSINGFLDTGDIRFVCLEKFNPEIHANIAPESPELDSETLHRSSSSNSSHSIFSQTTIACKRVIYAHSDILTRRSEYFATMLSSAFSEGTQPAAGERKIYTVVVEEADFETMYWLLKFCYANWLQFKERDDPRAAVEGIGGGWSASWLASSSGEWNWKTFHKYGHGDETMTEGKSAASAESLTAPSGAVSRSTSGTSDALQQSTIASVAAATSSGGSMTKTPGSSARQASRRPPPGTSTLPAPIGGSHNPRSKPEPVVLSTGRYVAPPKHYPISPRTTRQQQPTHISTADPHPHPTPAPPPASALSMYQVAHRYGMPGLANLALEHMMTTITPPSSFALLLATTTWEELHTLVQVSV